MAGFASGFFGTLVNDIKDREEYIRTQTEKKRDYLMGEGLKRRTQVQAMREKLSTSAAGLKALGIDEGIISAAVQQDPNEVIRLNETLQGQRAEIDAGKLEPNAFLKGVDGFKPSNVPLSEAVQKVLPDFVALTANERDPAKKQKSLFQVMFNLNPLDQIEENVYGGELIDGFTGADVTAALGQPLSMKGSGESNVAFNYGSLVPPDRVTERSQEAYASIVQGQLKERAQSEYERLLPDTSQTKERIALEDAIKAGDYVTLAQKFPEVLQKVPGEYLSGNVYLQALLGGADPVEFLDAVTQSTIEEDPNVEVVEPEVTPREPEFRDGKPIFTDATAEQSKAWGESNPNEQFIFYRDAEGVLSKVENPSYKKTSGNGRNPPRSNNAPVEEKAVPARPRSGRNPAID